MGGIRDYYDRYQIMPPLRQHMMRVTGVATLIVDHFDQPLPRENIITACLLHDMGNIIKFKLGFIPEFVEPEGLAFWQAVQQEYIDKYGNDEHQASVAIAQELQMPAKVLTYINAIGFDRAEQNDVQSDWGVKVCAYSDHRVGPKGIISLEERMNEGRTRFIANKGLKEADECVFEGHAAALRHIEKSLFAHTGDFTPQDITDSAIAPLLEQVPQWKVR